jgi:hypothetical protein
MAERKFPGTSVEADLSVHLQIKTGRIVRPVIELAKNPYGNLCAKPGTAFMMSL